VAVWSGKLASGVGKANSRQRNQPRRSTSPKLLLPVSQPLFSSTCLCCFCFCFYFCFCLSDGRSHMTIFLAIEEDKYGRNASASTSSRSDDADMRRVNTTSNATRPTRSCETEKEYKYRQHQHQRQYSSTVLDPISPKRDCTGGEYCDCRFPLPTVSVSLSNPIETAGIPQEKDMSERIESNRISWDWDGSWEAQYCREQGMV
jgi:hypothetical protein